MIIIYFLILGDRAKINKLVQMAWTFSNDRFVSLIFILILNSSMLSIENDYEARIELGFFVIGGRRWEHSPCDMSWGLKPWQPTQAIFLQLF